MAVLEGCKRRSSGGKGVRPRWPWLPHAGTHAGVWSERKCVRETKRGWGVLERTRRSVGVWETKCKRGCPDACVRPDVRALALPIKLAKGVFAECPRSRLLTKFFFHFFSSPSFPEKNILFLCRVQKKKTLGKPPLCRGCRVFFLTLGKPPVCRVFFLPSVFSAALGKKLFRRVPDEIHSANIKILGKFDVSGSVYHIIKP